MKISVKNKMKISKKIPVIVLVTSMLLGVLLPAVQGASPRSISIAIARPERGNVGTSVTVAGSTNPPNMMVDVCYTRTASGIGTAPDTPCTSSTLLAQTTSDATGAWSATFRIPESVGGNHPVLAAFDADPAIKATRQFTVIPLISVSPNSGAVDDSVQISGTGFSSSSPVTINYDMPAIQGCVSLSNPTQPPNTNTVGSFAAQCNVPESDFTFPNGSHQIAASTGALADSKLYTLIPSVSISPDRGPVGVDVNTDVGTTLSQPGTGATVTAKARGFIKLAPVTVCFDRGGDFTNCQSGTSSPAGSLTLQFPMAQILAGSYIFDANQTVAGADGHPVTLAGIRTATFTVVSDLDLLPDHARFTPSPLQVQATGTGFAAESPVTVVLRQLPTANPGSRPCSGGTVLALAGGPNVASRSTGSFFLNFSTPSVSPGLYQVDARDAQGNEACADFAIGLFLRFKPGTPNEGKVGDTVTIQGYSFKANSNVRIQMLSSDGSTSRSCDATSASFRTDSNGDFGTVNNSPARFVVPQCNRGDYKVVATDSSRQSGVATPYTVFPWIDITPKVGVQGTTVTVTGTGFDSQVSVNVIYFGGDAATDQLATRTPNGFNAQNSRTIWNGTIPQDLSGSIGLQDLTNVWQIETVGGEKIVATVTSGNFGNFATSTTFSIPESWGGFHPVYAREVIDGTPGPFCGPDGSGQVVSQAVLCGQPLRVQPTVSIAPNDPKAGESLTLQGSGYMWWEHYRVDQGQPVNNVFRLAFDFGRTTGYIDESRHILNGQRDTSWELGSNQGATQKIGYLPIALNQMGTIVYWDFALEDHTGAVPLGGSLGMVGSPFVIAPSLQPGEATVVAYRMQLGSLPTADKSEQTETSVTVVSAEKNSIDDAKQTLTTHIDTTVSDAQTAIMGGIGSAQSTIMGGISTAQGSINAAIGSAQEAINGHVDTTKDAINNHVDGTVSAAQTAINSNVDGTVSAAQAAINGHVDTTKDAINSHVDGTVSAAQTAINGNVDSTVSAAQTAVNSHVDSTVSAAQNAINSGAIKTGVDSANLGISDLKNSVPLTLQTPMGYVIAILAAIAALGSIAAAVVTSRRLKVAG